MIDYLGYLAGSITVLAFLPQVWKAWRTRRTRDVSWLMILLLIFSGLLWLGYGVLTHDTPLVATNVGMVSLNVVILAAKMRFAGSDLPATEP
ncbi:MAG: SemiSWEET family sugar transporter [Longimicrobiales bacterium]